MSNHNSFAEAMNAARDERDAAIIDPDTRDLSKSIRATLPTPPQPPAEPQTEYAAAVANFNQMLRGQANAQ